MSTATAGRAREYRVVADMAKHGWRKVMRAAASKGSADLFMVSANRGGALVQVGTAKSKRLGPADRARLIADASDSGCLAILATVIPGIGVRYHEVSLLTASYWQEWKP